MLHQCLASLALLDYPGKSWEVIVVNDGGSMTLRDIDKSQRDQIPLRFSSIQPSGPAAARNFGAYQSEAEFITFIDDDCTVYPDLLKEYARGFLQTGCDGLGGSSVNPSPNYIGNRAWHHVVELLYKHRRDINGNSIILVSNNASYRRTTFLKLGGFRESFSIAAGEDREFSMRLLAVEKGYRQAYWPGAKVQHHLQLRTPRSYLPVQFRYGRGTYFFSRYYSTSKRKNLIYKNSPVKHLYRKHLWNQVARDEARLLVMITILLGLIAHRLGRSYQGFLTAIQNPE